MAQPSHRNTSDRPAAKATGTLGKAMGVLDLVAAHGKPMRFTEILDRSDLPRGTLHRQLSNLVGEGLLSLAGDHSYRLGLRLLGFASRTWAANEFRTVAEPHLHQLNEATEETVHLGVLNGTEIVYLDKVESRRRFRMYSQIGIASPVYCTGIGKAALSVLPDDRLREVVRSIRFTRYTDNTLSDEAGLMAELREARATGIAYDREEHEVGIRCVAAPVHTRDMSTVAAISVTGPAFRVSEADLDGWSEIVRQTARAIMDDMLVRLGPRG